MYWVLIKAQKVQPPQHLQPQVRFLFVVSAKECLHTARVLHSVIPNQKVMAEDETAESYNNSSNTWSYW